MQKNFVAEPTQYPLIKKDPNRFKKTMEESAEIFAGKLSYESGLKKDYGPNWKQALRRMGQPMREFNHSIQSNTRVLAQWN